MRKLLAACLSSLLVSTPATVLAQGSVGVHVSRPHIAGSCAVRDSIAGAVRRNIASLVRIDERSVFDTAQPGRPRERSWIGRHPVITGALIGAAGGTLAGVVAEPDHTDMPGLAPLLGLGVGAGAGALAGALIGALRK